MSLFRSLRAALTALVLSLTLSLGFVAAPAPATAAPTDLVTATDAVEPAVVRIDTEVDYQGIVGAGTGSVIDQAGQVLTNFHVVQGADRITGTVGGRPYPATLVGYDRKRDIAVLQLQGAYGLPVVPIGDSNTLVPGQPVVALGNANGTDSPLTRETGTFTAFGRTIKAEDTLTGSSDEVTGLIEFAAPVRAGDSGGPVISDAGQVVGMTTAASVNFKMGPGGQGFAIPINDAMGIANQIRSGARSDTVHIGPPVLLGVGVRAAPTDEQGVLLHEVLRGGPAEQAGLVDGDVLLSIGGVSLDATNSLPSVLDRHYPGDVVDLTWIDNSGAMRTGRAVLTLGS
jgi:S1-C subfamily serine protease